VARGDDFFDALPDPSYSVPLDEIDAPSQLVIEESGQLVDSGEAKVGISNNQHKE
jgi:hypothetical protein